MAKRLPCPFCGSKSVRSSHTLAFYVVCDNCGAFGPTEEGPGSGELWNKRVASPPVAVQEERDASKVLGDLVSAFEWRAGLLVGNAPGHKLFFADEKVWQYIDEAKKLLAAMKGVNHG